MKHTLTRPRPRFAGWVHLALDVAILLSVIVLVTVTMWGADHLPTASTVRLGVPVACGVTGFLLWEGVYSRIRSRRWPAAVGVVGRAVLAGGMAFALAAFLVGIGDGARQWVFAVSCSWFVGLAVHHGLRAALRGNRSRVIVVGSHREAMTVRDRLARDRRHSYDVLGFVVADELVPGEAGPLIVLESIDRLPVVAQLHRADRVVFCMDGLRGRDFAALARELNRDGIHVSLTGFGDIASRRVAVGNVEGHPMISIAPPVRTGWRVGIKRSLDVLIASIALIALSPLLGAVALAIRIVDGTNPIFRQPRVGKGGELFTIFKFRTMVPGAEELLIDLTNELDGPVFKMQSDPRVTRIGRFLRRTSVDELPQLWNVLRGEMSLVGPRPFIESEVVSAPETFRQREVVTPGMTGRWQVSGRSDTDFDELDELDRWYVENWSLGQDLEILVKTVPAVFLARGAR